MFSDFAAAAAGWKDLGRIQKSVWVEYALNAQHRIKVGFVEDEIHKIFLLVTDAVLAAERPADIDTQFHDLFAHAKNLVDLIGIAAIKQD